MALKFDPGVCEPECVSVYKSTSINEQSLFLTVCGLLTSYSRDKLALYTLAQDSNKAERILVAQGVHVIKSKVLYVWNS